jgi:hypothetical protein
MTWQVRWSKDHSRLGRVLGVKDLFEAIELCLGPPTTGQHTRHVTASCCSGLMRVLCVPLGVSGSAVPRPVGPVPGLVVVRTLITGGKSPNRLSFVQHVEVFMYRGNGQVVVTGQVTHTAPPTARKAMAYSYICGGYGRSSVSQARQKEVAEAGIMYVKNYWKTMMFGRSSKKPRLSPYSDKYDVHVNIPYDSPVQVSQDMQPLSAKARHVCSNSECVCVSPLCAGVWLRLVGGCYWLPVSALRPSTALDLRSVWRGAY